MSSGELAANEYAHLSKEADTTTSVDRYRVAREAAAAFLAERNGNEYEFWLTRAKNDCSEAARL
ncbi:hypothetical protein HNO88_004350 [Novosphingobium chloroacetimidivorans]|uniref:Uncharacterized protein n=1 Tax=Novosphingobium chloroacetimidivorans TaxID=1428314 RepID=A0A7W7NYX0_9SPHN|nr:hypothetical protein [Novosphingobium chloroacetimidivorans]